MTTPLAPKTAFAALDTATVVSTYNQQSFDIVSADVAVVKMTCVLESAKVTFGDVSSVALFVTA
jgi:phosphoribosylaminoimidazole (AIR) synthetase